MEDSTHLLKSSATHLATFRHFRNNVDNGIQLMEPAFEAFCLMHQTFISLGSLYAGCLALSDLSSGFLTTQSYMKNLEEKFKLIPLPQTFIIGSGALDRIEIGCFPITFESLGLGLLNNLVTQDFKEISEENKNSLNGLVISVAKKICFIPGEECLINKLPFLWMKEINY